MCVVNIIVPRRKRSEQSHRIPLLMEEIGYEFLDDIIWKKPDGSAINRNGGFYRHRKPVAYKPNIVTKYILVFKKPAPFLIDKVLKNHSLVPDGYERTDVWEIQPETHNWHPAPFPEELAKKVIRYCSYEGDLVFGPFAGSRTVGKVCVKLDRRAVMSEINSEFCGKIALDIGIKLC